MPRDRDLVEVFRDQSGEWRWHRKSANGEMISGSGEGYENYEHAKRMAEELNPGVDVIFKRETQQY